MATSYGRDSRGGGRGGDRDDRGGDRDRGGRPQTRRFSGGRRRRQCICKEVERIDYKDVSVLRRFISDRGRMESGRKAGNCAKCQRELGRAISRARHLALLPYAPEHLRVTGSISTTSGGGARAEEEEDEEVTSALADGEESEDGDDDVEPSDEVELDSDEDASEDTSDDEESEDDDEEN